MAFIHKLTTERFAKSAAKVMQFACYLLIGFLALCTVLSFIGRQSFTLHTSTESFKNAICAEEDHDPNFRAMTVHMGDDIHIWTNRDGQIELPVQIGLSLMYAVHTVPIMIALWFLSRLFWNIRRGQIFTVQNSSYLLYYGLLQFFTAVFVPFIKLLICFLATLASDGRISIATGQNMFQTLIPSIAFIVAAYILRYGAALQDEVDHTL